MPLSEEQRARLEEEAKRRGIDPEKLIAAADKSKQSDTASPKGGAVAADAVPPNLYMYHLPFVRVNEVRETWLKLPPLDDGDMLTGDWLLKHGGAKPTEG